MAEQPEALRLADALNCATDDECGYSQPCVIAAELRRLSALNGELLEVAKLALRMGVYGGVSPSTVEDAARAAIAKAEGSV
jgi:hypothetical protein